MPEVEITEIPPLTSAEQSIVNCHSLLNIYNVLREELALLGRDLTGEPTLLARSLGACDRRLERLSDEPAALHDASHTNEFEGCVHEELATHVPSGLRQAAEPAIAATRAQLDSLLWILSVRSREVVARTLAPVRTVQLAVADLELDLQEFLLAMEQHSRGRLHFVYNLAVQNPQDYYVDLHFESTRSSTIAMPTLLRDIMRDLIANARKYTAPGGQLRIALHSGPAGLRCVIEDNGRGIPASELSTVVHFGRRGSNVADVRSYGAGCGLTKAFLATRQLGGRFWLASEIGRGTRVRLWLPAQTSGVARIHALQE
jgi:signal transduction histidine kinase